MNADMLWLAVDPGEDTGWSLWRGSTLVDAGTEKLWAFGDSVFMAVFRPEEAELVGDELAAKLEGIQMIVCEDWRLYPWEMKKGSLNWDQCRTARLIGSLTQTCRMGGLELVLQGAKIKERAEAAGAKALFMSPLDENRHANDAIRHGVYYQAIARGALAVQGMMTEDEQIYKEV
jgi:hypothetical protein